MDYETKLEMLLDEVENFLNSIPLGIDVNLDTDDFTNASPDENTLSLGIDLVEPSKSANEVDMFYKAIHASLNLKLDIHTATYSVLHELGHIIGFSVYGKQIEKVNHIYQIERGHNAFLTRKYNTLRGMSNYFYQISELDANIYANMLRLAYPEQVKNLDISVRAVLTMPD